MELNMDLGDWNGKKEHMKVSGSRINLMAKEL